MSGVEKLIAEGPGQLYLAAVNLATGRRMAHQAAVPVKAASTIKVPLLAAVAEMVEAGRLAWDQPLALDEATHQTPGSGVIRHLRGMTQFSLHNLATLMIIVSDNSATNALIDLVGYDAVNALCARLGATGTCLYRKMQGKPAEAGQRENLTSMDDQVLFYRLMHEEKLVSPAQSRIMLDILARQCLNSKIPRYLAWIEDIRIPHKTGTIKGATLDAGIVYIPGRDPVAVSVACMGYSPREAALADDRLGQLAAAAVEALT